MFGYSIYDWHCRVRTFALSKNKSTTICLWGPTQWKLFLLKTSQNPSFLGLYWCWEVVFLFIIPYTERMDIQQTILKTSDCTQLEVPLLENTCSDEKRKHIGITETLVIYMNEFSLYTCFLAKVVSSRFVKLRLHIGKIFKSKT